MIAGIDAKVDLGRVLLLHGAHCLVRNLGILGLRWTMFDALDDVKMYRLYWLILGVNESLGF